MRNLFAIALLVGTAAVAQAQQGRPKGPDEIPPRYGVSYRGKSYFQTTPKLTLQSALEAIDGKEFSYLVAHLIDPVFVDARVAELARRLEPSIEKNLAALRDFQQQNIDRIAFDSRIPTKPEEFHDRVLADARMAGFRQVVRDIQAQFAEDPQILKFLRRCLREGTFDDKGAGESAKVGLAEFRNRELFFKKIGARWYLQNEQTAPAPVEEKAPEPKKE